MTDTRFVSALGPTAYDLGLGSGWFGGLEGAASPPNEARGTCNLLLLVVVLDSHFRQGETRQSVPGLTANPIIDIPSN